MAVAATSESMSAENSSRRFELDSASAVNCEISNVEQSGDGLRFDSELPDTSSAEDESQKNVFRLSADNYTVLEEQLPAIPADRAYYIYPKCGLPELYYSMEIAAMYACNCGGSVDLIFTKVS